MTSLSLETSALREHLDLIKAWIDHWQEDLACNLKPTPSSLESAGRSVERSLAALARIESAERETV